VPKRSRPSSNSIRRSPSPGYETNNVPNFANNKELVRYVFEQARVGNRASPAAFLPDPPDTTGRRAYLSVNSLEVESLPVIADYHREIWQNNSGKVALAAHKVFHYREAGRQSGVTIEYDRDQKYYVFQEKGGQFSRAFESIPRRTFINRRLTQEFTSFVLSPSTRLQSSLVVCPAASFIYFD
jgi:hypothetical protein